MNNYAFHYMFVQKKLLKNIVLSITQKGIDLKEKAKLVPKLMDKCLEVNEKDGKELKEMLEKIMITFK